ncbi:SigE family RNA polymerase sigma factor [Nocardioides panacisoli]|uniref:SigE family RNA polymerase sigma factor n=1 Tax=Nocardioides panacisoli TaxID=627624 RepID=UPI001C626B06|nr:SigE family RNA polymerase sigma factor [Nocardioides panacisoli]QYJ02578.1 SigE family RNA polymerase sigma factor [Nocardioides panacisoli]
MSRRQRAAERDAEFADYLAARQPALLRTAYLLTGERAEAEDLLQTSLAKLYLAWGRVRDKGATDAYVRRIMVNELNSLWRRAWKRREVTTEQVPETAPHHDDAFDGTHDELWQVVQSLPERARAVVVLRYYEQLSEPEVADVLGISVGTVKSQCSRAMATLRERVPAHLHPGHEEDDR